MPQRSQCLWSLRNRYRNQLAHAALARFLPDTNSHKLSYLNARGRVQRGAASDGVNAGAGRPPRQPLHSPAGNQQPGGLIRGRRICRGRRGQRTRWRGQRPGDVVIFQAAVGGETRQLACRVTKKPVVLAVVVQPHVRTCNPCPLSAGYELPQVIQDCFVKENRESPSAARRRGQRTCRGRLQRHRRAGLRHRSRACQSTRAAAPEPEPILSRFTKTEKWPPHVSRRLGVGNAISTQRQTTTVV